MEKVLSLIAILIRLYQPRKEVLEGRWDFPEFELVK